jgi:FixJ family two-component response regulator
MSQETPADDGTARRNGSASDRGRDEVPVFLVDDDEAVRDAVAIALRAAGFRVVACRSARQLLECYRAGEPACLVVDLDLPDIEAVLSQLMAAPPPVPPTIMTSRRLRRRALARTFAALRAVVLEKPFGIDDLLPLVHAAIAAARIEREPRRHPPALGLGAGSGKLRT